MITGGNPGYFVFSLDTELAWGAFDVGGLEWCRDQYMRTHDQIRRLLDLLDRYRIPTTWAFVGHLLLDRCERRGGTTHPDVLRPRHAWFDDDWHALDPGTDVYRDPLWYGSDILKAVLAAEVRHEIASHTFSHVIVGDEACTREIAHSQLLKCRELHERRGFELNSVVFPRNQIGHLDVLRALGIVAYRGPEQSWFDGLRHPARRAGHLLHRALALPAPTYPLAGLVDRGLVNLPASMLLLSLDGPRCLVPLLSRRRQAFQALERAAKRVEMMHLWLHPSDMATGRGMLEVLGQIFERVRDLTNDGRMIPLTMAALAKKALGSSSAAPARQEVSPTLSRDEAAAGHGQQAARSPI